MDTISPHRSAPCPPSPAADGADGYHALGCALWRQGARDAAVAAFERAITLRPDHADARNNLGNALCELGHAGAALAHYRAALAMRPRHAPTRYNLGNALLAAGQPDAAAAEYRAALVLDPAHAGAHNNLGNALRAQGRTAEAETCYRQALALRADFAGTHNNLGAALLARHRPEEAAACFLKALSLQPDYAEACNNLGGAMLALNRPDEALGLFRRAVALDPAQVQARFGEAVALLTLGRLREGWEAYESRWLDPRFRAGTRAQAAPPWLNRDGEAVAGRTVLLHAEQGLGDTIQFVRYAPRLRALGARVVLEVQPPLVALLRGLADAVIAEGAEQPPHDWRCPLLSLPLAFRTELDSIPAAIPYVCAEPERAARWAGLLGARARRRIGLVFSGSPDHPDDALRSIPAGRLAPLLAVPEVEWHVAQPQLRPEDAAALGGIAHLRLHGPHLTDFAETAALLTQLDLVISVDTAAAHLAGALGRPVWLLLPASADFRWLRGRSDSPWYPTMRLFRQVRFGQWDDVLAEVAAALG